MKYVIGLDQSTQGTKALLFNEEGRIVKRADYAHRQIINANGWVSHDAEEIYSNAVRSVSTVIEQAGILKKDIAAVGISNQRETTVAWNKAGNPLDNAIVWQCARAEDIVKRYADAADTFYHRTGLPFSPYFPAAKMAWLLENSVHTGDFLFGTIDSWLLYKLTGGKSFKTDYSNASRTQLFNIHTLKWDDELLGLLGIPLNALPEVCDSDSLFGYTDFEGILDEPVPIRSMMGDSHGALFGQACHEKGMVKTTYGTGSSIMMNIGEHYLKSSHGLATSLAWSIGGRTEYVLEGNINYTGAVISWLKDDLKLVQSYSEVNSLPETANAEDTTVIVPAFSGLSAPYWNGGAKALICGMSRLTGRPEIVKAAVESIAFQIADVLSAMEADSDIDIKELRVDGGPTKNSYLMQFQSDLAGVPVQVPNMEELSASGVACLAGIAADIYDKRGIFKGISYETYKPKMDERKKQAKYAAWRQALELVLGKVPESINKQEE